MGEFLSDVFETRFELLQDLVALEFDRPHGLQALPSQLAAFLLILQELHDGVAFNRKCCLVDEARKTQRTNSANLETIHDRSFATRPYERTSMNILSRLI